MTYFCYLLLQWEHRLICLYGHTFFNW